MIELNLLHVVLFCLVVGGLLVWINDKKNEFKKIKSKTPVHMIQLVPNSNYLMIVDDSYSEKDVKELTDFLKKDYNISLTTVALDNN